MAIPMTAEPKVEPIRSTRTETELVAEAVWKLYETGVIRRTPATLARACQAVRVPLAEVRAAARRQVVPGRYERPGNRVVELRIPEMEPPDPKRPATRVREERDGNLFCRPHEDGKGAWLPAEEFGWRRDQRVPRRKSWCRSCVSRYQKARYLSAERQKLINCDTVATLMRDDPLLRGICPHCKKRFKVGQRVVAANVRVAHEGCAREEAT